MKSLKRRFAEWLVGPRCYIVDMDNPDDLEMYWTLRGNGEDVDEDSEVTKNIQLRLIPVRYDCDVPARYNEIVEPLNSLLKSNDVKLLAHNHTSKRVDKQWHNEYTPIVNLTVRSKLKNLNSFIRSISTYADKVNVS